VGASDALLGTRYRLVLPIDAEACNVEAFVGFSLPRVIFVGWTDEIDLANVARNDVAPTDVGRVR